jgi:exonuclease SbcC
MPNSPHEFTPTAEDLRVYLEDILPGSQVTNAKVNASHEPLLLLQTTNFIAAFAFANGDVPKTYRALYDSFKKYYVEQRGKWDALDLAFVYCVPPNSPDLERFCSSIETDVYFCRKFVVQLTPPIGEALSRLPFLPLVPLHGHSFRPPSAQTLLQQCGVPTQLARYLVIQRERSPEGIVEDCSKGVFGEPRPLAPPRGTSIANVDRASALIRLERIIVKNFRAYRVKQSFTVGEAVTVLYGPNGFGKTSLFDAIDFAATGDIGRIKPSDDAHFLKAAKHLDSKSEEGLVSLSFKSNGTTHELTRRVHQRRQAQLDGRSTDRKTVLSELTGGHAPGTDRVENFVSLFRATHLFSQEHQELAIGFENDCQISGQIVSRMLAFEDYANAVNKSAKVRDVLHALIESSEREITELSTQIQVEKKDLNRMTQTAQAHTAAGSLDVEIRALRARLANVGIPESPGDTDAATLRSWRASLESRIAESQSRVNRLSLLSKEAAGLPQMLEDLSGLQAQLAINNEVLPQTQKTSATAELDLQALKRRLGEIAAKRIEAQTRTSQLQWIRITKPNYTQVLQRQADISEGLKRSIGVAGQLRVSEEAALKDVRALEQRVGKFAERFAAKRSELTRLDILNKSTLEWQANRVRLAAANEAEQTSLRSLESLRGEERQLSLQVAALTAEELRLSRQLAEADRSQSELKKLLSQLQGHISNGVCPLCGEDHGSKDELVRRIQNHLDADASSIIRADLNDAKAKVRQIAERVATNKEKRQAIEEQLANLENERDKLKAQIAQFEDSAAQFIVISEAPIQSQIEKLRILQDSSQTEISELSRQAHELNVALSTANSLLAKTRESIATIAVAIADAQETLPRLQDEVNRLHNDSRAGQVPFDINPEQLANLEQLNVQDLAGLDADVSKAEGDVGQKQIQVNVFREETAALRLQLASLQAQISNLQKAVTQVTARLAESQLPPDVRESTILGLIGEESRVQAQFVALRDSAASIELAVDAATTSAALGQMLQNVRGKEEALALKIRKRDQHRSWLKYFEDLARLIMSQQSHAIDNFTHEYGPRASVIQQRLRAVYGFDEIDIRSHESTISVRVKRQGEELRPTDYFSQSQQQTLLLSLFLTACLSQTWSALSTVFLDDPVAHFDDLNTYAFLDLIVGLLKSDAGQRQFVLSTCDEKFLQLARQKFRHLGTRAKFYIFSAISSDGPIIDELVSTS